MCRNACLFICLFGFKREHWVSLNTPHILHKTAIFPYFSGIYRTSGHALPMGEHPWVTEIQ